MFKKNSNLPVDPQQIKSKKIRTRILVILGILLLVLILVCLLFPQVWHFNKGQQNSRASQSQSTENQSGENQKDTVSGTEQAGVMDTQQIQEALANAADKSAVNTEAAATQVLSPDYPPLNKYYIDEDIKAYTGDLNMDAYKALYDAIDNVAAEVDLSSFGLSEEAAKMLKVAVGDRYNYEFFYEKDMKYDSGTGKMKITYWSSPEEISSQRKAFTDKIQEILSLASSSSFSEIKKEMILYRYITDKTNYNYEAIQTGTGGTDMYNIIVENTGICYGYANTMKYLLNAVGIEAHSVKSPGHAWNIVKIDGEYYNMDSTAKKPDNLELFNFSDQEQQEIWNYPKDQIYTGNQNYKKLTPPECTSDKYQFLRNVGFYNIYQDTLYFSKINDAYKLYKISLDGTGEEKIGDVGVCGIYTDGKKIYYSDVNNGGALYRMNMDGTGAELLDNSLDTFWIESDGKTLTYYDYDKKNQKQYQIMY